MASVNSQTVPVVPKSIFVSKLAWTGLIVSLIPALEYLTSSPFVTQYPWVLSVIGVIIVGLRYVTTQPVTLVGS